MPYASVSFQNTGHELRNRKKRRYTNSKAANTPSSSARRATQRPFGRRDQTSTSVAAPERIRYALSRWQGLTRFLDDGRIEIDSNVVERSIRPIALNRKNALFAGSDGGAEHWAVIASLIETCKLNGVEPLGYLADVLTRIVNGHSNSQIDDLLPWAYIIEPEIKAVA